MKSYFVWLNNDIVVSIDGDAKTNEGRKELQKITIEKFTRILANPNHVVIDYEEINN